MGLEPGGQLGAVLAAQVTQALSNTLSCRYIFLIRFRFLILAAVITWVASDKMTAQKTRLFIMLDGSTTVSVLYC